MAACCVLLALGGCSLWGGGDDPEECVSPEEYQAAKVAPDLSVPAGLDRPDPTPRLDIPGQPLPAEPLERTAACLQKPPDYFDKPLAGAP